MRLKRLIEGIPILLLLLAWPALSFSAETLHEAQPQAAEAQAAAEGEQEETEDAQGPTLDERLDALLSEVSAYEEHQSQRCLNTRSYRTVKVLNTEHLVFSRGNKHWLNKLKRDCPTLKWNDLPVFEARGTSSLCENDPFYPSNNMDLQRGLSGGRPVAMHGTCFLGRFQQITPEQMALLTEQN